MKAVYCPYCGGRSFRSRTAEFWEVWPTLAPDGGFSRAVREPGRKPWSSAAFGMLSPR